MRFSDKLRKKTEKRGLRELRQSAEIFRLGATNRIPKTKAKGFFLLASRLSRGKSFQLVRRLTIGQRNAFPFQGKRPCCPLNRCVSEIELDAFDSNGISLKNNKGASVAANVGGY